MRAPARVADRIIAGLIITPSGCWEPPHRPDGDGYRPVFWVEDGRRRSDRAHRVMWELVRGVIPAGMTYDHTCRNRGCCNPDHGRLLTVEENSRRIRGIDYPLGQSCAGGHPASSRVRVPNGRDREGRQLYARRCQECRAEQRAAA